MGAAPLAARFVAGPLEPSIASVVLGSGPDVEDLGDAYWQGFRACPVCKVPLGARCEAINGRVVDGRPDGVRTSLPRAHGTRLPRTGRRQHL